MTTLSLDQLAPGLHLTNDHGSTPTYLDIELTPGLWLLGIRPDDPKDYRHDRRADSKFREFGDTRSLLESVVRRYHVEVGDDIAPAIYLYWEGEDGFHHVYVSFAGKSFTARAKTRARALKRLTIRMLDGFGPFGLYVRFRRFADGHDGI